MGRLIDVDAFRADHRMNEHCEKCTRNPRECQYEGYYSLMDFCGMLDDAPIVNEWISVKERLPEEHESIFYKLLGTPKWSSAMWKQESDKVLVCVSFPDWTSVVTTGCLHDSVWVTTVSKTLPQTVTHWMPLPEPPKEETD